MNWSDLVDCNLGHITVDSQLIYDFRESDFYQKIIKNLGIIDYHIWLQVDMNNMK
ncbi:conserved hypothetical protein [Leptospira interrogans serovar Manilae]|uniref:Uncharacterized protein n=2 Tax=Leptospira interrogans TaxID=173 RepID=A0AAQ1NW63_LEPIR|nr:hypothetical protein LEP1GSC029_1255 [Leptospira interrogans str. 2002000626]SOR60598.1 conserved hypothetical protein [Leptospira interrogans serovar Manilae]